jgi:hypothetical protein
VGFEITEMHLVKGGGKRRRWFWIVFFLLIKRGPQGRFENMKFQKKMMKNFSPKIFNIYKE